MRREHIGKRNRTQPNPFRSGPHSDHKSAIEHRKPRIIRYNPAPKHHRINSTRGVDFDDRVQSIAQVIPILVTPGSPIERIVTGSARKDIVAGFSVKGIVSGITHEHVVPLTAHKDITAVTTGDLIRALFAEQHVVTAFAGHPVDVGCPPDRVGARRT